MEQISALALIDEAVARAITYQLCPHRVWAIAKTSDQQESILPQLIPPLGHAGLVKGHNDGNENHDRCTFDFCECSRIDYTFVEQRHECPGKDCTNFQSFSPEILRAAAEAGHLTAWKLNGESMLRPPEPFMAISHVWADGTGTGTRDRSGLRVNKCLHDFFCQIAEQFNCKGIWWDTICMPKEKEAKMKAINNMHRTYANARITLVHDCYLRECEWTDAESACFAIVMSPWFTRGWTALELMQSRKVKVIFKPKDEDYVIKDLDDILDKATGNAAAGAIKRLRCSTVERLPDLLSILGLRITSKPKDMAIIAALLTKIYVPASLTQQEIYQRILKKIGHVFNSQLFHDSAPMPGGFSWCPANLFDMQIPSIRHHQRLYVEKEGTVRGFWSVCQVPEKDLQDYDWRTTHPLTKIKVQTRLLEAKTKHLLLVEYDEGKPDGPDEISRALLVKPMRKDTCTLARLHCQLVGPIYFRYPISIKPLRTLPVIIGDTEGLEDFEGTDVWENVERLYRGSQGEAAYQAKAMSHTGREEGVTLTRESIELLSTMLLFAVEKCDHMVAGKLFLNGAKPDAKDAKGRTALILAVMNKDRDMVEQLFQKEAKLDVKDSEGRTALIWAAIEGDGEMVELMFQEAPKESQCIVDFADNYSWTALHYAAWGGHVRVVRELCTRSNVNVHDTLGQLPLHLAAERNHAEVAEVLLCKTKWTATCSDGQTVLHRAALGSHKLFISLAGSLEKMVIITQRDGLTTKAQELREEIDNTMSVKDRHQMTALDVAAKNGYKGCKAQLDYVRSRYQRDADELVEMRIREKRQERGERVD